MVDRPPPFSRDRFRFVWKVLKALRAEWKGTFENALLHIDEAAEIMPLRPSQRVHRAILLLRAQRVREAHIALAALRDEFKGSDDSSLQYLRHYCTYQLSLLTPASGQWSFEAKQAKRINCSNSLKRRFPMVTADEIHETVLERQ